MQQDQATGTSQAWLLDGEGLAKAVEEAIRLAGGDSHAALAAALVANSYLEAEVERLAASVARGYVRGRIARAAGRAGPAIGGGDGR